MPLKFIDYKHHSIAQIHEPEYTVEIFVSPSMSFLEDNDEATRISIEFVGDFCWESKTLDQAILEIAKKAMKTLEDEINKTPNVQVNQPQRRL